MARLLGSPAWCRAWYPQCLCSFPAISDTRSCTTAVWSSSHSRCTATGMLHRSGIAEHFNGGVWFAHSCRRCRHGRRLVGGHNRHRLNNRIKAPATINRLWAAPNTSGDKIRSISGRGVQAIFCRRRHQPSRPPPAKIRPGRPASVRPLPLMHSLVVPWGLPPLSGGACAGGRPTSGRRRSVYPTLKLPQNVGQTWIVLNRDRGAANPC